MSDNSTSSDRECNETKIFVGNVPFQCTEKEFFDCFKNIPGFCNAEIITKHNSTYSRGFGFVTVKTNDDAENLLKRNDIIFKDRILRFTEYNFQEKDKTVKKSQKKYIYVKNVPSNINRDQLKNIFSEEGTIGACFINTNIKTGESRGSAVIEIKEHDLYQKLLDQKYFATKTGHIFELIKWKNKSSNKNNVTDSPCIKNKKNSEEMFRIGFNAGVNVGIFKALHDNPKGKSLNVNLNLH